MNKEQMDRIEEKLDQLLELAPTIEALGKLLVRSHTAGKRLGLSKDTLTQNTTLNKYEEVGHRRTFVEVGELSVVRSRKKRK